ncbi:MAG: ALG3 protein-domain-containing protein [Olpidium bornovanus]|uniref:Dol-P-Man:Man(5)GlcNAc(2)-PP-Dol alpha-1,3-mannosyltransferase n=1 Tax=Olpidium bornovanus TaxID=278681 RepID=A0A8H7ZPS1_9FUNG|nr:MAG: ALG3 protein-domain-containing protein [Olpidium bornovanus]
MDSALPLLRNVLCGRRYFAVIAAALVLLDCALTFLIIEKVPYTEIDWVAYMQEVEGYQSGKRDYAELRGDTGPLIPGRVCVRFLRSSRPDGRRPGPAERAVRVRGPPRRHARGRFPDILRVRKGTATFFFFLSPAKRVCAAGTTGALPQASGRSGLKKGSERPGWKTGSAVCPRLGDPVKAAPLDIRPASLQRPGGDAASVRLHSRVEPWQMGTRERTVQPGAFNQNEHTAFLSGLWTAPLQSDWPAADRAELGGHPNGAGLPFLLGNPWSYVQRSFQFSRVFDYTWTVNWRFLSEDVFLSKTLARLLLACHVLSLVTFLFGRWCRTEKGVFTVLRQGFRFSSPHKITARRELRLCGVAGGGLVVF